MILICVLLLNILSVLSTRANDLPLPKISSYENGVGFMLEDIPGLRFLHVIYGKNEKDTVVGVFQQAVNGMWYHWNNNFKIDEGEKLLYRLVAEVEGKLIHFPIGSFLEWLEPKLFYPKNAVRRGTVVFRDDFDHGDQPDRNHWDYEVSMYGGHCKPSHAQPIRATKKGRTYIYALCLWITFCFLLLLRFFNNSRYVMDNIVSFSPHGLWGRGSNRKE